MQTKHIILTVLFITSALFYYQITDPTSTITAKVTQVTDGDTLKTDTLGILRLLGINTPEKNQPFYQEAKDFLAEQVQNKTIQIESHGPDRYKRTLSYIFLGDQNINAKILSKGLATLYYYDKDSHYNELKQAEEFARLRNLGIWEKSPDFNCIKITEFKTNEPESLTLQNNCNYEISLTYKDDATHIYKTTIGPNSQYTKTFSHIWNTDGDSIYIYDTKGLLIFHRYN